MERKVKKIVLAYSGGLDTSIILKWLVKKYNAEVIAFVANIGQKEDFRLIEEKAFKTGASKVYIKDLREEFVRDYIFKIIKANAVYESKYLLGTAIARPLIAKHQVEVAKIENADALAHGATGKGNDQVRFELTYKALAPDLKIIAPWRKWEFKGREELINFAIENKIPVPASKEKPYSSDANLFHISYESGILENIEMEPDEDMFTMTKSIDKTPDKPLYISIEFENGVPIGIDGKKMSPVEILEKLNSIGSEYGIGRVDMVENRLVGIKNRGVYETPGGTILHIAHKELESITLDRETMHFKEIIALKYAELVYYGQWFTILRKALDSFIDFTQKYVTGSIKLKLYKGNVMIAGRKSPYSLYNSQLATFEKEEIYNQKDAEGFINLFGLQIKYGQKDLIE